MSRAVQSSRIRELKDELVASGYVALDEQADALGLCRSTAWTIIRGTHKNSGLSVAVINRMLACPRLPGPVRAKLIEYVREKMTGCYGHSRAQLRRFAERLALPNNVAKSLGLAQPSSVANRAPVTRRMLRKAA
jgi:hypothetical protein